MKSDMALTIEPDTIITYPRTGFNENFSFVIVFGQFFGIMPLHGIKQKNLQDVKFCWKSFRMLFSVYNIVGAFAMGVFCVLKFALDGLQLDKTGRTFFY